METSLDYDLTIKKIRENIKDVPDFPQPGILFKDITPVLKNGPLYRDLIHLFAMSIPSEVTQVLAIESRGFIFGSAIAHHLGVGLVLVRKKGKLPRSTIQHTYSLEYGQDTLEIHEEDINSADRVVIIDDVLATGGTAKAVEDLCSKVGAQVLGHRFLIEIAFLEGRKKLSSPSKSFISY